MAATPSPLTGHEERTHPSGPPLPAGDSHWARLRARLVPIQPRLTTVISGLVALALVALAVVQFLGVHHSGAQEDLRADAAAAARRVAVDLTTIGTGTASADIARVINDSTGGFHDQYVQQADGFQKQVTESGVTSRGQATSAGVVSADDAHAVVLVAVNATVTNKQAPAPAQRVYRMRITLDRVGEAWLASNMEFVP